MISYNDIDFILVGPGHTGSTWLRDMLAGVPGILIPPETNYLTWLRKQGSSLEQLYGDCAALKGKLLGEHANIYFSHPDGAALVAEENKDAKIIIMMREPLTVVEKHYRHDKRWGQYPVFWTVEVACEHDAFYERYIGTASYRRNLARWLEKFPAKNIFIFNADIEGQVRKDIFRGLLKFLGVQPLMPDAFERRSNVSIFTPFPVLHRHAQFGSGAYRKVAKLLDPINVWAARFIEEPRFSQHDRDMVTSILGEEATLDGFKDLAMARHIAGSEWF